MSFVKGYVAGALSILGVFGVLELLSWWSVAVVGVVAVIGYWKRRAIVSRVAQWAVQRSMSKMLGGLHDGGEGQ